MFDSPSKFKERLAGAVDLAVDLATLGEYGVELRADAGAPACASERCETAGRKAGWEALATPRRGSCRSEQPAYAGCARA